MMPAGFRTPILTPSDRSDSEATRLALEYLERSGDLHCVLGLGWRFEWIAGPWEQVLGWSADQLEKVSFDQLLHPSESGLVLAGLERGAPGEGELLGRVRCSTAGTYRWLGFIARIAPGGVRTYVSARDVGDRVEREEERARRLETTRFAATHDPLTGLANRALLEEHLARALARGARGGERPLVLFVDLDDFKRINDELGHEQGDAALRAIAGRIDVAFRPSDLVARHGGDEFVIVIEGGDAESARDRVRRAVSQPLELRGREYRLSASVGTASAKSPGIAPAELIAAADEDMYGRRRSARGRAGGEPRSSSGAGERQ